MSKKAKLSVFKILGFMLKYKDEIEAIYLIFMYIREEFEEERLDDGELTAQEIAKVFKNAIELYSESFPESIRELALIIARFLDQIDEDDSENGANDTLEYIDS